MQAFDIVVVGGGMVGAASACLLADLGLKVAVVEAKAPIAYSPEQPMDLRVSAISAGSVDVLKSCGVWTAVLAMRSCVYRQLETWENNQDKLSFSSEQLNLPELGYIVENRIIQLALWEKLQGHKAVTLFCPSSLSQYQEQDNGVCCHLSCGTQLTARLALACDGANSKLRSMANIGITAWDYKQHCMLINIETKFEQQDTTWQEFSPTGPRSFLPLAGNHASLVWYHQCDEISRLSRLDAKSLKQEILAHFPALPGDFSVVNSGRFPLTRRHAKNYYQNNVILLGDAAHSINPLAGQGVNLGFKDIKALVFLVQEAIEQKTSWADIEVKKRYQALRKTDNHLMQSSMDLFYLGFSNDSKLLSFLRNKALKLANHSGPLKKAALRYALGLDVLPQK